jgi:hypothetical protein
MIAVMIHAIPAVPLHAIYVPPAVIIAATIGDIRAVMTAVITAVM